MRNSAAEVYRQAGYAQLAVEGQRRGEAHEHGTLSFTRFFDAGRVVSDSVEQLRSQT